MQKLHLTQQTRRLLEISQLPGLNPDSLRCIAKYYENDNINNIGDNDDIVHKFGSENEKENNNKPNVDDIIEKCKKFNISIVSYLDPDYPKFLKSISDFPPILYVRGKLQAISNVGCAVIGTRKASNLGIMLAKKLSNILVESNLSVISGLALGIDAAAHEETLNRNGIAIAVLAHGLDKIYPKQNQELGYRIIESGGSLVSEYPPGTPIHKRNFVHRNRIQSGLSIGSVVIESGAEGGSIHHANFAYKQGKKLFCIIPKPPIKLGKFDLSGARKLISEQKADEISSSNEFKRALEKIM